jgi:hypothetical protein
VKIYLHDPVYTLGDTTFSVEESVSASRTLSSADILCEAGFQTHHICSPDTEVQELAARTASQLGERLDTVSTVIYATCLPMNGSVGSYADYKASRDVKHLMDFPASRLQAACGLQDTQNPLDIPESVLGQLGNRVQHALRAFTPKDQKAVRAAAQTFRANPELDTATVITELGVGEALVSVLQDGGVPSMVERTLLSPPESHMGAITPGERRVAINNSPLAGRYDNAVDRESAHELLRERAEKAAKQARERDTSDAGRASKKPGRRRQSIGEAFIKSLARTVGNQIGRQLMRGILGSMKR